ncbi:MAG: hypothetical protein OXS30_07620 [Chloroflexota bacterium]|nr:hypothetical protein [Chloroflexota bacterium]
MGERIYNLVGDGGSATLSEFQEASFDEEDALQELIARNPELLAGEQMNPEDPPRWILISREAGIADQADGAARWSLDHALIDQRAVPTLVETKRGDNRELRRTIVGQMLDYAAHASKYWSAAELREQFEQHEDADVRLSDLLDQEDPDQEEFWKLVETNLNARNLRLLFVADRIPDELATVVEFLNEQMPRIEVLAVEIKQFRGDSGLILVPRVIGRVSAPAQRRSASRLRLSRERFLDSFPTSSGRDAAQQLLRTAEASGARIDFGDSSASIRMHSELWPYRQPVTVAWLHPQPDRTGWNRVQNFTFGWAAGHYAIDVHSPLKRRLDQWSDEFAEDAYSDVVQSSDLRAWSVSHQDAAENIEAINTRLARVLKDIASL